MPPGGDDKSVVLSDDRAIEAVPVTDGESEVAVTRSEERTKGTPSDRQYALPLVSTHEHCTAELFRAWNQTEVPTLILSMSLPELAARSIIGSTASAQFDSAARFQKILDCSHTHVRVSTPEARQKGVRHTSQDFLRVSKWKVWGKSHGNGRKAAAVALLETELLRTTCR